MSPEIERLFHQLVDLPEQERAEYYAAHGIEAGVRAELEVLFAHDRPSDESIQAVIVQAAGRSIAAIDEGALQIGASFGPYRLTEILGQGGMGTVYRAEQSEPVRRTLAIKVIRILGGNQMIARFDSERQALAMMEHTNIARLYDAGVTHQGHPYFAMECVEGVPVTKYCDDKKLDIRDRLRLFQQICGAVQHAHQKGVIHRDLKPSNILVMEQDGIPTPKVIDFGVAKALHTRLTDKTLQTEAGMRVGTLRYMSPEQERGEDIDTRADIYSLGVLLYELLVGATPRESEVPVEPDIPTPTAKLRQMKDSAEMAANRSLSKVGLSRLLKGELEWITLKALDADPARRYASASEFAADIGRYLDDETVLAQPPGTWLSIRKFVRRNRLASAVAAALVIGVVGTSIAAAIAIRQRGVAQQRAIEMRQLTGKLIFELHDEIVLLPGATKAAERLAAISTEYLQKLEAEGRQDPQLALELATAYNRLSAARGSPGMSTGDSKSAIEFSRRASEFGRIAESKQNLDDNDIRQLLRTYVTATDVFMESGLKQECWQSLEELSAVTRRVAPAERTLAEANLHKMAGVYYDKFDTAEKALDEMKKSLELFRQTDRKDRILAAAMNLARTLARTGDLEGSLVYFEESLRLAERLSAENPSDTSNVRGLYLTRIWLGDLLGAPDRLSLERPQAAETHYAGALRIAEKFVATDAQNEMAKLDVARACGKLGSLIASTQPERALALMDRAAVMARATSFGNRSGIAMRLAYLTESVTPLVALNRIEQAKRHTVEAKQLGQNNSAGVDGGTESQVLRKEAEWMYKAGRVEEALRAGLRVRDLVAKGGDPNSFNDGFQWILALEAVQKYARGSDPAVCREATGQASGQWDKMAAGHPNSAVIRAKALEAKKRVEDPAFCTSKPPQ